MNPTFENIKKISLIISKAEQDIFIATGMRRVLICVKPVEPDEYEYNEPEEMLKIMALALQQPYEDFYNPSRKSMYVHLRILGAFFLRMYYPHLTLKKLGEMLRVDHTTVIHYLATARDMIETGEPDLTPKYEIVLNAVTQWLATE